LKPVLRHISCGTGKSKKEYNINKGGGLKRGDNVLIMGECVVYGGWECEGTGGRAVIEKYEDKKENNFQVWPRRQRGQLGQYAEVGVNLDCL
jgi:hypothetical protein